MGSLSLVEGEDVVGGGVSWSTIDIGRDIFCTEPLRIPTYRTSAMDRWRQKNYERITIRPKWRPAF